MRLAPLALRVDRDRIEDIGCAGRGEDVTVDDDRGATVNEVRRVRPVPSIAPRKTLVPYRGGGGELPPGVHVGPCLSLTHRRPELYEDPTAFRPERFLDGGASGPATLEVQRNYGESEFGPWEVGAVM